MTTEEALKIDPARYSVHGDVATALRVLQNALREAQAAVAQMRKDAARVADEAAKQSRYWANEHSVGRQSWLDTAQAEEEIARDIRRLPAPVARTYDDGVRDAAKAAEWMAEKLRGTVAGEGARSAVGAIEALLSPAPAVAPVAQNTVTGGWKMEATQTFPAPVAAPTTFAQSECMRCGSRAPGMHDCKPVAFDAEAALVELLRLCDDAVRVKDRALFAGDLAAGLQAALDAGRGAR